MVRPALLILSFTGSAAALAAKVTGAAAPCAKAMNLPRSPGFAPSNPEKDP